MKTITADEFDRMFDAGEDVSDYVDWSKGFHPNLELRPLDVSVPGWLAARIDQQAEKLGLSRQELVQRWLEERLADHASAEPEGTRDVAE
jgi:hypothetical protein